MKRPPRPRGEPGRGEGPRRGQPGRVAGLLRRARLYPVLFVLALLAGGGAALAALGPPGSDGATATVYTDADVVLLIIYITLALGLSFLCSVAEAVLLSITPSFVVGLEATRPRLAARIEKLKHENVDRSLAAILTLNTIAHTVGAIGSGAKATVVFGSHYFGLFSAVMTLLILFLSEIVPKTFGAVHWRGLAAPTAHFVRVLTLLLYPLIRVSELLTRLIAHGKETHAFNREEFKALAEIGAREGYIREDESRIIRNLLRFDAIQAGDIMTPRTVMRALQQEQTVSDALGGEKDLIFSRLPVYGENRDDITGFVLKHDLLIREAAGKGSTPLSELRMDLHVVPEHATLTHVFEQLLAERAHIALVVGEYGETAGLVTLEDVVETLLGLEIVDETDHAPDMRALARRQWEKRARAMGLAPDG